MIVIDKFKLDAPKTKDIVKFLKSVDVAVKPLFLLHESNMPVIKSAGNIPGATVLHVDSINVYDVLNHVKLIATPEAVRKLEEVFGA
jgi:large subunit ribosomal protein L4